MADYSPEALATPDTTMLEEIFDLGDEGDREVLRELVEQLLEDGPHRMAELIEAMAANDLGEVDHLAHRLKSSFGNLGFTEASSLCDEVMQAARGGDANAARALVQKFEQASDALVDGIARFLGRL